jgi:hypothetical protein
MTEADWQTTHTQPGRMIQVVAGGSRRKLRFAACGFARLVWDRVADHPLAGCVPRYEAAPDDPTVPRDVFVTTLHTDDVAGQLMFSVVTAPAPSGLATALAWAERVDDSKPTRAAACDVLREVFGNPFRPRPPVADWLGGGWLSPAGTTCPVTPTARAVAERIAAGHHFADLPVLADALDDAGCPDADVIDHLRHGTGHRPGCWALDLVLGRL